MSDEPLSKEEIRELNKALRRAAIESNGCLGLIVAFYDKNDRIRWAVDEISDRGAMDVEGRGCPKIFLTIQNAMRRADSLNIAHEEQRQRLKEVGQPDEIIDGQWMVTLWQHPDYYGFTQFLERYQKMTGHLFPGSPSRRFSKN